MNIRLNKEARKCSLCDRGFGHGEDHISTLKVQPEDDIRADFCLSCWKGVKEKTQEELYGIWIKKYLDPHAIPCEDRIKVNNILSIIEKFKDSEDDTENAIAYIATQILKRQKILKSRRSADGKIRYTDSAKKIRIAIREPSITFTQLKKASDILLEMITKKHGGEDDVR